MSNELIIYKDRFGRVPIKHFDFERIFVGSRKTETLYLGNASEDWPIKHISVENTEGELEFKNVPEELEPNEIKPFVIEWSPSVTRRKGLDVERLFHGELWID